MILCECGEPPTQHEKRNTGRPGKAYTDWQERKGPAKPSVRQVRVRETNPPYIPLLTQGPGEGSEKKLSNEWRLYLIAYSPLWIKIFSRIITMESTYFYTIESLLSIISISTYTNQYTY